MPEEIKDYQYSEEEREMGTKLLNKYKKESTALNNAYFEAHDELLNVRAIEGHRTYMKLRKPILDTYRKADKDLHDQFVQDAEDLGFKLKAL